MRRLCSEDKRRFIYQHQLFVKHVGSSLVSGFKNPVHIKKANADYKSKIQAWIRRDLRVLLFDDIEIIKDFVMAIMEK